MMDFAQILAAAAPGDADIITRLGITVPYVVMQVVSFSILAAVLWKFAFKPVFATMEERESKIDAGLKYAEEMKVKLAEAEAEKKQIIAEASNEAKQIVTEARTSAEARIDKSAQDAIKAAEEIIKKAELQIAADRKQMLDEARSEIARLVVATSAKVLSKELSEDEKSRYSAAAATSLS